MPNGYNLLFWLVTIACTYASPSSPTSEGEMYGFNGETFKLSLSTETKGKKPNNIFNLLSGFHNLEDSLKSKTSQSSATNIPKHITIVRDDDISYNDIDHEGDHQSIFQYSSLLKKWIKLANHLSDSGSAASDLLEDVVGTVKKVATIYNNELGKRVNKSDSMFQKDEKGNQSGILTFPSKVINTLLQPNNMEKIYEIGTNGTSEDEILEQLASLIIGSEDRGGGGYGGHGGGHYGLTKDPITIIALLALAAYLIRAAIEFLRATNGKRSLNFFEHLELNELLPDVLSNVYSMIDGAKLKYERHDTNGEKGVKTEIDNSTWTSFTFDVIKLALLQRKDNKFCFRKQLCNQLNQKSISDLQLLDAFWIGVGLYSGDQDVLLDVYKGGNEGDSCNRYSNICLSNDAFDGNCKSCSFSFRNEMKQIKNNLKFVKNLFGIHSLLTGWTKL